MFLVLGHRGASTQAPENTLDAFELALVHGADGLEFDIHLAGDGTAVVIHDASLDRTTGDPRDVASTSVADLARLDAGSWFGPAFANARIPTLDEVLDTFGGRCFLNIELKPETGPADDLVPEVIAAVRARGGLDGRVLLTSFHAETIARAKRLAPEIGAGIILLEDLSPSTLAEYDYADGFGLPAFAATREGIALANGAGKQVLVWTVNDVADARLWRDAGAAGVITDEPGKLATLRIV